MKNEGKEQRDYNRSQAAKFYIENYSREERYLIFLSRDLKKNSKCILNLGVMKAENVCGADMNDGAKQNYFDFICNFESLLEKMKEFKWTPEFMKKNGIDFKSYRKLYFSIA